MRVHEAQRDVLGEVVYAVVLSHITSLLLTHFFLSKVNKTNTHSLIKYTDISITLQIPTNYLELAADINVHCSNVSYVNKDSHNIQQKYL